MKVVVIGGSDAGIAAAVRIRKLAADVDESGDERTERYVTGKFG